MKKEIILLIILLTIPTLSAKSNDLKCNDTDGGSNYFVTGKTIYTGETALLPQQDTCIQTTTYGEALVYACAGANCAILENICSPTGSWQLPEKRSCLNGCVNGACNGEDPTIQKPLCSSNIDCGILKDARETELECVNGIRNLKLTVHTCVYPTTLRSYCIARPEIIHIGACPGPLDETKATWATEIVPFATDLPITPFSRESLPSQILRPIRNLNENLSELEEIQTLTVIVKENETIIQGISGTVATTDPDIRVIEKNNGVYVQREFTKMEIEIDPLKAVEAAINISKTTNIKDIRITGYEKIMAYEIIAERMVKIFGFFETIEQIRVKISLNNGQVLNVEQPWWSFLTVKPTDEKEIIKPITCIETDSGLNETSRGVTLLDNRNYTDTCATETTLNEYLCATVSSVGLIQIPCTNGCTNGACIPATTCHDTDPGIAPENAGSVFENQDTFNDECITKSTLREYYCINETSAATRAFNCPAGCKDGRCSPKAQN